MSVFLSIVIPVYNMENYLDACLDSVIRQKLQDYEVILVNDGSTDRSQAIMDNYSKDYPDVIHCFYQDNQGLGSARNKGVANARGEYILFVDSDDWLEENTLNNLCAFTKRHQFDLVIFDSYRTVSMYGHRNLSSGHTASFGPIIDKDEAILKSVDPAHAWKRLYKRELFDNIAYPSIWFEDVALTPVITSRAEKIGYFKVPVYNYRVRKGSITDMADDKRNLDVIVAWQYILEHGNPNYKKTLAQAVVHSIGLFCKYRRQYKENYINFMNSKIDYFSEMGIQINMIQEKQEPKIPRILHYCWFGGGAKSDLVKRCIESWRKYMPDFEIIEWNEDNCDVYEIPFTQQAYVKQKWAFVADYFRFKVLNEMGGIYLDTDVEANASPDDLLYHSLFMGFEKRDVLNAAVLGATSGHDILQKALAFYKGENYISRRGNAKDLTLPKVVEYLLEQNHYDFKRNGERQSLQNGVEIFPVNVFCLNVFDGKNIFDHHFDASWWDVKSKGSYKYEVLKAYFHNLTN